MFQIMTHVQGKGYLCIAQVPSHGPDAYSIAEDIARAMSHRGRSYVFADGHAYPGFTNGQRDPGSGMCAYCGEEATHLDAFGKPLCPDDAAGMSATGHAIWRLDGTPVPADA